MALNWLTKTIHRMIRRNAIEKWETKVSHSEATRHVIWPLAKPLLRDRPKAPTAIHSPSGLKFLPLEKANVIADCPENQFLPHDLCGENHEQQVMARVWVLSEAVDDSPPERVRPYDVQKLIRSFKLKMPVELMHSK
jgi:hypothetical protein